MLETGFTVFQRRQILRPNYLCSVLNFEPVNETLVLFPGGQILDFWKGGSYVKVWGVHFPLQILSYFFIKYPMIMK